MHAILDFIMYTWIQSHSGYALINLWEGVVLFSITQYNVAAAFFFLFFSLVPGIQNALYTQVYNDVFIYDWPIVPDMLRLNIPQSCENMLH